MNSAFEDIVRQNQSAVRRFLLNLTLGDAPLADDLAQDTFVKAFTHYGSFRGQASVETWLIRIAYNTFYDYTRSHRHETADEPSDRIAPATGHNAEIAIDVYAALSQLKDDERTCITLQLIDGYDIASIARITGMKEGTIKSHLSRGKEKLANYLRHNGYDRR